MENTQRQNRFQHYQATKKNKEAERNKKLERLREENARLREFRTYMEETSLKQVLAFETEILRYEDPGALQHGSEELCQILDE
jgi:hypothetical protein